VTLDRRLAAFRSKDHLARERYQELAVRVSNLARKNNARSLMVTSSLPGEGKTTVALNLAWLLAKPGEQRVLLIDANLRRPAVHRMLGISPRRAWTELLDGTTDVANTAIRIDPNGLYLLPTCHADFMNRRNGKGEAAPELLTSRRVDDLLVHLEEQFDLVLIDSPPLADCAEAQRLATIAGATIIVVRAGETSHSTVEEAVKLVPRDRRLGVVLNMTGEIES
jgi:capsular exopolysaccharide synthesis family protein